MIIDLFSKVITIFNHYAYFLKFKILLNSKLKNKKSFEKVYFYYLNFLRVFY